MQDNDDDGNLRNLALMGEFVRLMQHPDFDELASFQWFLDHLMDFSEKTRHRMLQFLFVDLRAHGLRIVAMKESGKQVADFSAPKENSRLFVSPREEKQKVMTNRTHHLASVLTRLSDRPNAPEVYIR